MLVNVSTHYHHKPSLASMLSLVSAEDCKAVNHAEYAIQHTERTNELSEKDISS